MLFGMLNQKTQAGIFLIIFNLIPILGFCQLVFEPVQDVDVVANGSSLKIPWNGGLNSGQYGKADLDGDAIEELIIYDRSANTYQVYRTVDGDFISANELIRFRSSSKKGPSTSWGMSSKYTTSTNPARLPWQTNFACWTHGVSR